MCHEPVIDIRKLPKELQDQVYRPNATEVKNVEIQLKEPTGFGADEET